MEEVFKQWSLMLSVAVEGCAALLIALAAVQAIWLAILYFFRRPGKPAGNQNPGELENIRLKLGRWLALALEFELAADILRTAVAPTWEEIGKLGAIVVLRTALNYFLQREIEHVTERQRTEINV